MTNLPITELTLAELRPLLIDAVLPHVPFDGWTDLAIEQAGADLGLPPGRARLAFSDGPAAMVDAYIRRADDRMLAAFDLTGLKVRDRIRTAVRTRFEQAASEREAVRRAVAILALPQNAALAARALWRTADTIWRAAGDTATDYNHYTKRLILGGVYSATLVVWLADETEGTTDTWTFLDRRIDGIMRFEKGKAKLMQGSHRLPSLSRFLGRLRYPAI